MQRHILGIVAIVVLAVGAVTYGGDDAAVAGTCLRIGAVLALLWLAMPQLRDVPVWILGAVGEVALGGGPSCRSAVAVATATGAACKSLHGSARLRL
jgi:hypothetical protein